MPSRKAFPRLDNRLLPPLLITCILIAAHLSFGILEAYERTALGKGFLLVSAIPLTRSSYHAGEDFARLRAARQGRA